MGGDVKSGLPAIMLLETVISGGQTGADEAGLAAALGAGYKTGGMAPKNYHTELGENWTLKSKYGLIESTGEGYKSRTWWNVMHSDGTVIFGRTAEGGTKYTWDLCVGNAKPFLINPADANELRDWLCQYKIQTLNVAGNRESVSPGIYKRVYDFLSDAFVPF